MSIYIGNDLEDRLEALEVENALLKEYNEYQQIVDEIDHMSDLHLDSSFYKRSMKLCTEVVPYTNSRLLNTSVWINCYFSLLTLQPFLHKTREPLLCKSAKTLTAKQAQPPYGNETDYITKHLKSCSPSPKNLESVEFLPHCPFWLTVQLVLF